MDDDYYDYGWKPYVSAAARRYQAARAVAKLTKKGRKLSPIAIEGRAIARTFWGKAWCDNLERYSDFANRLPRGRTYVRNGSVVDLQIAPGAVKALVSGSDLYTVQVTVTPVPKARWSAVCTDCAGEIDSLIELLQGRLSNGVMTRICQEKTGLFPSPAEISFTCSCPDWASMCKHVAAVLYGIGARLDEQPDLLFALRKVDQQDLIADGGTSLPGARKKHAAGKVLETDDLSAIFGIDIAPATPVTPPANRKKPASVPKPPAVRLKPAPDAEPPALMKPAVVASPAIPKSLKPRIASRSAAERARIAKRMKEYWVARRNPSVAKPPTDDPNPAAVTKPAAKAYGWSGNRAAVSKRMKEYWAARRRAKG